MKPLTHARSSVKKYGGKIDDYLPIHEFIDSPKQNYADVRQRAVFHNSFGPYVCVRVFGDWIYNSDDKPISIRQIAEDHIVEDLGQIPTLEAWLKHIPRAPWQDVIEYNAKKPRRKVISYEHD